MKWFFEEHVCQEEQGVWRKIDEGFQQELKQERCVDRRRIGYWRSQYY
jgi:hypothetical protein